MPRRRASAPSRSIASLGPETVTDWRAFMRAEFERAADLGEQLARRLGAQRQRRHAAVAAGAFLLPAARDDDPRRLLQRQRAGGPGRADLADAVADMRRPPRSRARAAP